MLGNWPKCNMGSYNWSFQFDDPKVDVHMAFGQGIYAVHSYDELDQIEYVV